MDNILAVMIGAGLVLVLYFISWVCAKALHHFASLFHSEPGILVVRETVYKHPEVEGSEIIDAEVIEEE
jgi:hypothetical protein